MPRLFRTGRRGGEWHELAQLVAVALFSAGCVSGAAPTLLPEQIPAAVIGRYYEVKFTAEGGDGASIHATGLPSGLDLWSGIGAGLLFGTPQVEGTFNVVVTAGSGGPTMFTSPARAERTYSMRVEPGTGADGALAFDYSVFLSARSGQPFSFDFCKEAPFVPFESPDAQASPPTPLADACADGAAIGGGQPPYRFTLYCLKEAEFCGSPTDAYNRPPEGFTLSPNGRLTGTSASEGRWKFIVCAIDQRSDHACSRVELDFRGSATPT